MSKRERKAPAGTIIKEAKRNDWQTPEHILERVRLLAPRGHITFDPATAPDNPTRAVRYCAPGVLNERPLGRFGEWVHTDGLNTDWTKQADGGLVFINPPYGTGAGGRDWLAKIQHEAFKNTFIVALLGVSRTEQTYMADMMAEANAVCFVRGRIAFRNPDTGDKVSGNCYASWLLGFNVPNFRRWREALEPVCGTTHMMAKGEKSLCMELLPL